MTRQCQEWLERITMFKWIKRLFHKIEFIPLDEALRILLYGWNKILFGE
jgi:hypothetical protein